MVLGFVANLLNRLKWAEKLPESEVVIRHRGAPDDAKRIKGEHITEIKKGHFSYMSTETNQENHIPMHRVLEIWIDEKLVWKKRPRKAPAKGNKGKGKKKASPRKKSKSHAKKATKKTGPNKKTIRKRPGRRSARSR